MRAYLPHSTRANCTTRAHRVAHEKQSNPNGRVRVVVVVVVVDARSLDGLLLAVGGARAHKYDNVRARARARAHTINSAGQMPCVRVRVQATPLHTYTRFGLVHLVRALKFWFYSGDI